MRFSTILLLAISLPSFAQTAQPTPSQSSDAARAFQAYRERMALVYSNDFGQLGRYRDANAALSAPAPDEKRVVFYGDSITDAWHLDQYFPNKGYINRGISGQTTSQMLVRFRQDVIDLKAAAVVVLAGTNDIAGNTGPISIENIEENYATLAELARVHGIQMIFSSVIPVHNYTPQSQAPFAQRDPAKILALNAWLKSYCAANNLVYVDYFDAMVDEHGLLRKELANDGLHPVDAGYRIMAPLAEAGVEKALAR
jgi:acyl-CoA thioesterase-1